MTSATLLPSLILYLWIQGLITGVILFFRTQKNTRKELIANLRKPKVMAAGSLIIFVVLMGMMAKNTAMAWTPNPAYVAAIGLLSPFWVMLFNKWRGVEDKADIRPGIAIVLAVSCLILVTS
jgi:NADH:ubiquinone oxidoreductase subunit 6 (subunit J)